MILVDRAGHLVSDESLEELGKTNLTMISQQTTKDV